MNMQRHYVLAIRGITYAAVLLCASGDALGQTTLVKPSGGAATSDATRYYELGLDAARQKKWERARDLFEEAWRRNQHYQIAANLGMAELKLGKHKEAAVHLTYYLENARGMNQADWEQGQAMLKDARASIGAIDIIVDRPGVEVFVDGKSVGRSPIKGLVFVDPGLKTIQARFAGYRSVERVVDLSPGAQRRVELRSESLPAQPTIPVRESPPEHKPGPLALKESSRPSPPAQPASSPERSSAWRNAPVILSGGVTAVALGAAIASTVHANQLSARRHDLSMEEGPGGNTHEGELISLSQATSDWSNYAFQWFIGTGVAAAGTVVLLVLRPRAQASARQEAGLSLSVSPRAVGIQGRW